MAPSRDYLFSLTKAISGALTVVTPSISREFQGTPGPWDDLVVHDHYLLGFTGAINFGAANVETEWMLIWNDDAEPHFGTEFADELVALPEDIVVAAPAKRIHRDEVVTTTGEFADQVERCVHTHCMVTDWGPRWIAFEKPESDVMGPMVVKGSSYCPLFAVRTEFFNWIGGFDMLYSPGYYEDADFWRTTRSVAKKKTAVLPWLEYSHFGRGTFAEVYTEEALSEHIAENFLRYLRKWRLTDD